MTSSLIGGVPSIASAALRGGLLFIGLLTWRKAVLTGVWSGYCYAGTNGHQRWGHHMKRGKRDHNRRNNFWHISLTAAVAALVVHNAINGGPAKARGHVLLSAFTHSP